MGPKPDDFLSDDELKAVAGLSLGNNHTVKNSHTFDLLPKDLPFRKSARLRERAESIVLLVGIAVFWTIVFTLNFFVGQASTPLIR